MRDVVRSIASVGAEDEDEDEAEDEEDARAADSASFIAWSCFASGTINERYP
jgi:hypothetical protein